MKWMGVVCVNCILCMRRDEYQTAFIAPRAQLPCQLQAVHRFHLNIQQQDIIGVPRQNGAAVLIGFYVMRYGMFV